MSSRSEVRLIGSSVQTTCSSSTGPLRSMDHNEVGSLAQRIILEPPEDDSCSKPLGHRARRAQQTSSHLIETCEWPKESLQRLGEKALKDVREFERLWDYLLRSRTESRCILAAKNAIEALNSVGYSFSGKDLRGVNIPGANLSYGIFHRTNFTGANLEGVNFQRAHLESALFVKANLKNVDFGEFYLKDSESFGTGDALAVHRDDIRNRTLVATGESCLFGDKRPGKIHLWSLEEQRKICTWKCNEPIISLVFLPEGERIVSVAKSGWIGIWNVENGTLIHTFKANYVHKNDIIEKFSEEFLENLISKKILKPIIKYLDYFEVALGDEDGVVEWGGEENLEDTLKFLRDKVRVIGCTVPSRSLEPLIACTNASGDIYVWNLKEYYLWDFINGEKANGKAHFIFGDNHLIIPIEKGVKLFHITTKEVIKVWSGSRQRYFQFQSTVVSPDERFIASFGSKEVIVWSYENEVPIRILNLDNDPLSITFSSDSKFLAVSFEYSIQVWNISNWTLVHYWSRRWASTCSLEFIDQDRSLVSFGGNGPITVSKLSNSSSKKLETNFHPMQLKGITPDGRKLFYKCASGLKVLNAKTGDFLYELKFHDNSFFYSSLLHDTKFAISRDGKHFMRVLPLGKITLWNQETKTEIFLHRVFNHIQGIAFLPTGRVLVIEDDKIIIHDPETQEFCEFPLCVDVLSYAVSEDGRWLAIGSKTGVLVAWDLESNMSYSRENIHFSKVVKIKFYENTIISISVFVHIWNLKEMREDTFDKFNDAWMIPGYPDSLILKRSNVGSSLCLYSKKSSSGYRFANKVGSMTGLPHLDMVSMLVVHPKRRLIATGGYNGRVQLFDPINNKYVNLLWGHKEMITDIFFSEDEDGLSLFSSSKGHTLCWSLSPDGMNATLKWRLGSADLNDFGVNTYEAVMDQNLRFRFNEEPILSDYIPTEFFIWGQNGYSFDKAIDDHNLKVVFAAFEGILQEKDEKMFLEAFLVLLTHLKDLVPPSYHKTTLDRYDRYPLSAMVSVAESMYNDTAFQPTDIIYLSLWWEGHSGDMPSTVHKSIEAKLRLVIERFFSMPAVKMFFEASPFEAYNAAADVFCTDNNEITAFSCYSESLRINPHQGDIFLKKGLLDLKLLRMFLSDVKKGFEREKFVQRCEERALKDLREAQRLGVILLPEVLNLIKEIEAKHKIA